MTRFSFRRTRRHIRRNRRRGVTLMEIMFSIGVVIVGLLGVIVLLPLAARYAEQGVTADRSTYFANAALSEFSARGFGRPEMWLAYSPRSVTGSSVPRLAAIPPTSGYYPLLVPGREQQVPNPLWRDASGGVDFAHGGGPVVREWRRWFEGNTWSWSPPHGTSFCIDPQFVAARGATAPAPLDPNLFPYYGTGFVTFAPRMLRVTIRRAPTSRFPMGGLLANQIFVSEDALSVDRPSDRTLPASQVSAHHVGPDGQPGQAGIDDDLNNTIDDIGEMGAPGSDDLTLKRLNEGRLSWFATLVPKNHETGRLARRFNTPDGRDTYVLSIVVVDRRDQSFALNTPLPSTPELPDPNNERLVDVILTGGGEVRLIAIGDSSARDLRRLESELDLTDGQWIMFGANTISGQRTAAYPLGSPAAPYFRWFRVLSTDSVVTRWGQGPDGGWGVAGRDDDGDGIDDNYREAGWRGSDDIPNDLSGGPYVYSRYATLEGPDWDRPEWDPSPPNPPQFRTYATIVTGVVTVLEKTIRLESSSLWRREN